MNKPPTSFGSALFFLLAGTILFLALLSGCLYNQNRSYASENRELMLQNDSILSANIELTRALGQKEAVQKNQTLSFKTQ